MIIRKSAIKALKKIPVKTRESFMTAFEDIENGDTDGLDIKSLSGRDGYSRLRIGSYKAIYTINMEIIVIRVGPRGDVYK
ncbi:MAG: type II toxin-antitoxin system RelE/ParE family toxin [Proteobacteria bacterium]|nr:type II toxin-antitoxin system RelE/ParE family toxin [Pseudomonadota bacterium]